MASKKPIKEHKIQVTKSFDNEIRAPLPAASDNFKYDVFKADNSIVLFKAEVPS